MNIPQLLLVLHDLPWGRENEIEIHFYGFKTHCVQMASTSSLTMMVQQF